MQHPTLQGVWRHIDELDLVGHLDDPIGHRLALTNPCHIGNDVVQALEVLDVDGGDHLDTRREQIDDVLPSLGTTGARDVRVRELIDEGDLGIVQADRVRIHLLEHRVAVGDRARRDQLQPLEHLDRARTSVGLDARDDHAGAALGTAPALGQHPVGLADTGRGAEVDAQRR